MLRQLGAETREVRVPGDLDGLDALVIPGGESTTITHGDRGCRARGARSARHHAAGRPVFGTCAGMIVCDDAHLGLIDATAERNAFGRQLQSFEAELEVEGIGDEPLRAVFIRAPWVAPPRRRRRGRSPTYEGHPVAIRGEGVLACAFHPELTDDPRLHALFMAMTTSSLERDRGATARRLRVERSESGQPGEDPGRLLDQGEGGRRRRRSTARAPPSRCCWRSTRRC